MMADTDDQAGLISPLISDGRHLLTLGTIGLMTAGSVAIFLAAAGQFLPHDVEYLGMSPKDLCRLNGCSIVHFMIHDRASFGGVLLGLSTLYFWLIQFPLKAGLPWAWWTMAISVAAGFLSFLTYLGTGYFDSWHGLATLLLLPCFGIGLAMTYCRLPEPRGIGCLLRPATGGSVGRTIMLVTAAGLFAAGAVIVVVGMTVVFVPEDLQYMGTTAGRLREINPRLIPLIAHDRAGFGSGVWNVGFLLLAITWCGRPSRHRWQAVCVAATIGFGTAIGVHPIVGYNNPVHLAPAIIGALCCLLGLVMTWPSQIKITQV